jgi:lysophospholipase L1-like esterase
LPAGTDVHSELRQKYEAVHALLRPLHNGKNVFFFKYAAQMIAADGTLNSRFYAKDGIHLQAEGYAKWAELLRRQMTEDKIL